MPGFELWGADERKHVNDVRETGIVMRCGFEGARRLWAMRGGLQMPPRPILTDRQRDCVLWVARGKSDWEISQILGVGEETVARHIKQACERYGVNKRTYLVILTLFDGTLTFSDIFRRRYYPFPE